MKKIEEFEKDIEYKHDEFNRNLKEVDTFSKKETARVLKRTDGLQQKFTQNLEK